MAVNYLELSKDDKDSLSGISQALGPTRMYYLKKTVAEGFKALGTAVATIGGTVLAFVPLFYIATLINPRLPDQREAYKQLESRPAIVCSIDSKCDELKSLLRDNKQFIDKASENSGVPVRELEALIAASYLNQHREERQSRGYFGLVQLKPEEVGVTAKILESDSEQDIYTASRRLASLRSENLPEVALAMFFGNSDDINSALREGTSAHNRCRPSSGGRGACGTLEDYRIRKKFYNELMQMSSNPDPAKRMIAEDRLRSMRMSGTLFEYEQTMSDKDLKWLEDFERSTRWYNNIKDDYTREAVNIFYSYLNTRR